jgi:hypothetical protein
MSQGEKSEAYLDDCDQLAAWLRKNTDPDTIVHVNTEWIADMVSLLADRRTDFGAWWECSKESAKLEGRALRDWDPQAVFVCIKPDKDAGSVLRETELMPGVDRKVSIGRFDIGLRDSVRLQRTGETLVGWRVFHAPGAAGSVQELPWGFAWTFPAGQEKLAMISVPWRGQKADGVSLRLTASKLTGDLVLGVRLEDGTDLRWPVSIAQANQPYGVRALFRRMTDEHGSTHKVEEIREVYLARPPDKPLPKRKQKEWCVEVSDLELLKEVR